MPDFSKELVSKKLPTFQEFKEGGSSAVQYIFVLLFIAYFFYKEYISSSDCGEKIAVLERVVEDKNKDIEKLNARVATLETALFVNQGILKQVEEQVSPGNTVGGSK